MRVYQHAGESCLNFLDHALQLHLKTWRMFLGACSSIIISCSRIVTEMEQAFVLLMYVLMDVK